MTMRVSLWLCGMERIALSVCDGTYFIFESFCGATQQTTETRRELQTAVAATAYNLLWPFLSATIPCLPEGPCSGC